MPEVKVFRLYQLCESIANVLRKATGNRTFWVSCEIVRINERRGHRYLELVDMEGNDELARMSAVIWGGTWKNMLREHGEDMNRVFESGKKILIQCSIEFHEVFGLKLQIHNVDLSYTIGDLESRKRKTLEEITKKGLLRKNASTELSPVVKKIIIVSSERAAGYEDFVNHLVKNTYNYGFSLKLIESSVQGVSAEQELCAAIGKAQDYKADAIVLIRGGGSRLDLEVFNSLSIAVNIANSRIPVITGIGHESDETVADLVAHTRLKTPTAVAHFFLERNMEFEAKMQWGFERIQKEAKLLLKQESEKLNLGFERYKSYSLQHIARESQGLNRLRNKLYNGSTVFLHDSSRVLERAKGDLNRRMQAMITNKDSELTSIRQDLNFYSRQLLKTRTEDLQRNRQSLQKNARGRLKSDKAELRSAASFISVVHPSNILKRGFAIVKLGDTIITKASELKKQQRIDLSFHKFEVEAEVIKIKKETDGKEE